MPYFVRRNSVDPIHDFISEAPPARVEPRPSASGKSCHPRDPSLRALERATNGDVSQRDYSRVWPELLSMWS